MPELNPIQPAKTEEQRPMEGLLAQAPKRVILVGLEMPGNDWPIAESLEELAQLATTAGVECADRLIQKLDHPNSSTVLGSGKVKELEELARSLDCDAVIFDLELKPSQHRNLERELQMQVLDRTALILIIFGQRARTREGRLQVELAQIEYDLPRLARQWSHLSRQSGGGGATQRGEGEKQIEIDRRMLRRKKDQLQHDLDLVRTQRQLHRERRKYTGTPVVALVGYTNAGKSTLLNRLAGGTHTLAEDKLFATLDPTTRRVRISGGQEFLLSDTVGFVQRLPHTLVAAFRATLEEVTEADLLLHVVDCSHPQVHRQVAAVEEVLEEIGAGGLPMLIALNKADLLTEDTELQLQGLAAQMPNVKISAMRGEGLDSLLKMISDILIEQYTSLDVMLPYDRGDLVASFHHLGRIDHEAYEDGGTHIKGFLPQTQSGPFLRYQMRTRRKSHAYAEKG